MEKNIFFLLKLAIYAAYYAVIATRHSELENAAQACKVQNLTTQYDISKTCPLKLGLVVVLWRLTHKCFLCKME